MGKYSHLKLPQYIDPDAKARDKVNSVKDAIIGSVGDVDRAAALLEIDRLMTQVGFNLTEVNTVLLAFCGGKYYAAIFARGYREARAVKETLQEHLKAIELTLEAYTQLVIDQFEVEGTESLKLDDGSTIRVQATPYAGVVDKEAFRRWCVENGLESQLQLWPSTTASLTKERLLEGLPEPDGVKAYMKAGLVFTKGSSNE